eukprot:4799940-Pleurochrysis_carterae.AAC.4
MAEIQANTTSAHDCHSKPVDADLKDLHHLHRVACIDFCYASVAHPYCAARHAHAPSRRPFTFRHRAAPLSTRASRRPRPPTRRRAATRTAWARPSKSAIGAASAAACAATSARETRPRARRRRRRGSAGAAPQLDNAAGTFAGTFAGIAGTAGVKAGGKTGEWQIAAAASPRLVAQRARASGRVMLRSSLACPDRVTRSRWRVAQRLETRRRPRRRCRRRQRCPLRPPRPAARRRSRTAFAAVRADRLAARARPSRRSSWPRRCSSAWAARRWRCRYGSPWPSLRGRGQLPRRLGRVRSSVPGWTAQGPRPPRPAAAASARSA